MIAHSALGTRPPSEQIAVSLLVQASSPDLGGGDAAKECISSLQKDRSVLEQFIHNLMLALGALPI
jgi:hypothetical protein